MAQFQAKAKAHDTYQLYNPKWEAGVIPLWREMIMVRKGGSWEKANGTTAGNGLAFHFKACIKLIWPEIVFHPWLDLIIDNWLTHRTTVVLGPSSSGKSLAAAVCNLTDYYIFPTETTCIVCSTTRERMEDRVWGEIKGLHKKAVAAFEWLPGHLIESKQRIITVNTSESKAADGRDFRNGLVGVPAVQSGSYVGLGSFVGIKNKRMRLLGDELSLLPRVFVDAISNLDKNPDFKAMGLGNPKETTDALGVMAEPAPHLGGWEGGIDQIPKTKAWETRRRGGIAVQLVGTESPNLDGKMGIPLITQEQIDTDVSFYGKDSLWFSMMNQGMMPRGQGSRRVITRQMCEKFGAKEAPIWLNTQRVKIAFLDAAYRGVGGDRCVFGVLEFGEEATADQASTIVSNILMQDAARKARNHIMALTDLEIVPIDVKSKESAEDQITNFVKARCEAHGIPPENFWFDSGMRTSLVSSMSRLWSPLVESIDCGGTPSDDQNVSDDIKVLCKDYYSKKITELWFNVRHVIEAGQFRGITEDVMLEGCAREWTMVGKNKIEVEIKAKTKAKTGRSPDLFDGLAVGVWGARQRGFTIKKLANTRYYKQNNTWKRELREQAKGVGAGHQLDYAA